MIDDPLIGRRRPDPGHPGGAGVWPATQLCDLVQVRSADETGTTIRVQVELA